jgi:predicted phage terminase large subunit-like protein
MNLNQLRDDPQFSSLTHEEKAAFLRELYKRSPWHFGRDVMGFDVLSQTHKRWERYILDNLDVTAIGRRDTGQKYFLFQMPRETYKSTFFTCAFSAWALANNPNLSILITSSTQGNARLWLGSIKRRLENERFRAVFGDWDMRDGWRETDITIRGRTVSRPEPSISCAGLDTTVTAKHFDIILADDLVTPEDRDSPAKRARSIKYWDDIIDLLNKKWGVAFFIGTPWHYGDLYKWMENKNLELLKLGQEIKVFKEPAYIEREGRRVFLFPEILPEAKLQEIRTKKTDVANFSANYLLNPILPESQIFKEDATQFFDYHNDFPKECERVFVHVDPSTGESKNGDFCAMVVVAYRKDGRRLVVEVRIEQMRPTRREEVAFELYQTLKKSGLPQKWQIETVGNQTEVKRSLIKYFLEKGVADFEIRALPVVANKTAKITSLELPISNGNLLFRQDWRTAPGNYHLLLNMLYEFPIGHDDGPDALKEAFDMSEKAYKVPNVAAI